MRAAVVALVLLLLPAVALTHAMPNSTVRLAASGKQVQAKVEIPLSELAAALDRKLPASAVAAQRPMLETYLRDHMALTTTKGVPWGMRIDTLTAAPDPGRDHDHDMLLATIHFSPPAGPDEGAALSYDAVLHKVASHYALVYLDTGATGEVPLARLQAPQTTVLVAEPPPPPPPEPDRKQWLYLAALLAALAAGAWGFYFNWRRPAKLKR